jgi:PKD repeat protein
MKNNILLLFLFASTLAFSQNCTYTIGNAPHPVNPLIYGFGYTYSGIANTFHWDFGDGDTSNIGGPVHTYATPGTYIYCLTINSCPAVCDTIVIPGGVDCNYTVKNLPHPIDPLTFGFGYDYLGVANSFHWDFGDGDTSNLPGTAHTYPGPGTYIYCLTINSCPPVCDTIVIGGTVGVTETVLTDFSLHPNPASENLNLTFDLIEAKDLDVEIYSLSGALVLKQEFEVHLGKNNLSLSISELPKGLYLLHVADGTSLKQIKFLKQ